MRPIQMGSCHHIPWPGRTQQSSRLSRLFISGRPGQHSHQLKAINPSMRHALPCGFNCIPPIPDMSISSPLSGHLATPNRVLGYISPLMQRRTSPMQVDLQMVPHMATPAHSTMAEDVILSSPTLPCLLHVLHCIVF